MTSETDSSLRAATFRAFSHNSSEIRTVRSGVAGWLGTLHETTGAGDFDPLTLQMVVDTRGRQGGRLPSGRKVISQVHQASAAALRVLQHHSPRGIRPRQQNRLHAPIPSPVAADHARCLYTAPRHPQNPAGSPQ